MRTEYYISTKDAQAIMTTHIPTWNSCCGNRHRRPSPPNPQMGLPSTKTTSKNSQKILSKGEK